MQVLLLGAGTVTSRLNMQLAEQGHSVIAQIAAFTPQHIDLFDFRALVVVSPESSVSPESLVKAAERGKMIFVVAGVGDGMASWANGVGVPSIAYPPSDVDINKLYEEMRRADAGNLAADDQYRRAVLGSDMSARIQSGMAVRKIAITSPKGGTGKTTVAVNLAVALALSGITTYLVDADGNAGALQYHMRMERVNTTMIGLLRREIAKANKGVMGDVASGAAYLNAFTPLENLPTLRVLPGLITDALGDEVGGGDARGVEGVGAEQDEAQAAGGVGPEGTQGAVGPEGGDDQAVARGHGEAGRHQAVQVVQPVRAKARVEVHVDHVHLDHHDHRPAPQLVDPVAALGGGLVSPN